MSQSSAMPNKPLRLDGLRIVTTLSPKHSLFTRMAISSTWQTSTVLALVIRAKDQCSVLFIILITSATKSDFPNWRNRCFGDVIAGAGSEWLLDLNWICRRSRSVVQQGFNSGHDLQRAKKKIIRPACESEPEYMPLSDTGIPVYRYDTGNDHRYRYTATEHGYRYLYRYPVYRRAPLVFKMGLDHWICLLLASVFFIILTIVRK